MQRPLNLRRDRAVQVIHLVNDEEFIAPPSHSTPDNLLRIAIFVAGGRVDHVDARIERALQRGDAAIDWLAAVGQVASTQQCGGEAGSPQRAARDKDALVGSHAVLLSAFRSAKSALILQLYLKQTYSA